VTFLKAKASKFAPFGMLCTSVLAAKGELVIREKAWRKF
jgi:hypothetical protein